MSQIPKFLKKDGLSLLFKDEGELIFYIPELYFERNYAIMDGDSVTLIGLFNYALFDKNDKLIGDYKLFNFPTMFTCVPSSINKISDVKLGNSNIKEDYRTLKFKKDDIVIASTKVPMSVENIEIFLKMVNTGKIPNSIPYNILHDVFIRNIELNGERYPVSTQLIGMVFSEICRSSKDITIPYRLGKSNNMHDYRPINITDIPKLVSPFTSITSQNWDESVVNAITNTNYKKSPLEKLFLVQ